MLSQLLFLITCVAAALAISMFTFHKANVKQVVWLGAWCTSFVAYSLYGWVHGFVVYQSNGIGYLLGYLFCSINYAVAVWWLVDLLLAVVYPYPWTGERIPRQQATWIRLERGLLLLAVVLGLTSHALRTSNVVLVLSALAMVAAILVAFGFRLVLLPFEPDAVSGKAFIEFFRLVNKRWPWYTLPTWPAVFNLAALREDLRKHNLHGTQSIPISCPHGQRQIPAMTGHDLIGRNPEGFFNDPQTETMGCGSQTAPDVMDSTLFTTSHPGARFGRNVPLEATYADEKRLLTPNPQRISRELLARTGPCIEAQTVNLLLAAWIQFEVHDWFSHGEPITDNPIMVPGLDAQGNATAIPPIAVRRTRPDPTRDYQAEMRSGKRCPMTFVSSESHWWDASHVYGANQKRIDSLRAAPPPGGILADPQHGIPNDSNQQALTGFRNNWWVGLSMLHTLFACEHNAICTALHREYPNWSPDQLFAKARLINAALIAKIHTIEWTPALLQNKTLEIGMNANWYGLFTRKFIDAFGRLGLNEAFWGIPGSGIHHHGAHYALTEEFAAVYRLHPLMPDQLTVRGYQNGEILNTYTLPDGVVGDQAALASLQHGYANLFYSFGHSHPGELVLHNYPQFLRNLTRPSTPEAPSEVIDLAMIDILRDRERGVPRYNEFRRHLRMPMIRSFEELNAQEAHVLRRVYGTHSDGSDKVEDLDLMIGMFAEKKPEGFAISDTAFRIFILMASRRLKSDRFVAEDFRPEIYTPLGMDWVNRTSLVDIIRRHYPELQPALYGVKNAFVPWDTQSN